MWSRDEPKVPNYQMLRGQLERVTGKGSAVSELGDQLKSCCWEDDRPVAYKRWRYSFGG